MTRVRTTALRTMAAQNRPAFHKALAQAASYGTAEQKRIGLLYTRDKRRLGRALRKGGGEWWLKLARHAIVARPALTFPVVLRMLNRSDWESRLQAAWVLMAYPPAP